MANLDPYEPAINFPSIPGGMPANLIYQGMLQQATSRNAFGADQHVFVGSRGILNSQRQAALYRQQQAVLSIASQQQAAQMSHMMAGAQTALGRAPSAADRQSFDKISSVAMGVLGPLAAQSRYGQNALDALSVNRISPVNIAMAMTAAGTVMRDPVTGMNQMSTGTTANAQSALYRAMLGAPVSPDGRPLGPAPSYGQTGTQIGRNVAYGAATGQLMDPMLPVRLATNQSIGRMLDSPFGESNLAGVAAVPGFTGDYAGFTTQQDMSPLGIAVQKIREAGITDQASYEKYLEETNANYERQRVKYDEASIDAGRAARQNFSDILGRGEVAAEAGPSSYLDLDDKDRSYRLLSLASAAAGDLGFRDAERATELSDTLQAYLDDDKQAISKTVFGNMDANQQATFIAGIVPGMGEAEVKKLVSSLTPSQLNPHLPEAAGGAIGGDGDFFSAAKAKDLLPSTDITDPRAKAIQEGTDAQLAAATAMMNAKMSAINGILKDSGMDEFLDDVEEQMKLTSSLLGGAGNQVTDGTAAELLGYTRAAGQRLGLGVEELQQTGMMGTSIAKARGLDRDFSGLISNQLLTSAGTYGRTGLNLDAYKKFGRMSAAELSTVSADITAGAAASREGNVLAAILRASNLGEGGGDNSEEGLAYRAVMKQASGQRLSPEEREQVDTFMALPETEKVRIAARQSGISSEQIGVMIDETHANQNVLSTKQGALSMVGRAAALEAGRTDMLTEYRHAFERASVGTGGLPSSEVFIDRATQTMANLANTLTANEFGDNVLLGNKFQQQLMDSLIDSARMGDSGAANLMKELGIDVSMDKDAIAKTSASLKLQDKLRKAAPDVLQRIGDNAYTSQALIGKRNLDMIDATRTDFTAASQLNIALSDMDQLSSIATVLTQIGGTGESRGKFTLPEIAAKALGHDIRGDDSKAILGMADRRVREANARKIGEHPLPISDAELKNIHDAAAKEIRDVMVREKEAAAGAIQADQAHAEGRDTLNRKAMSEETSSLSKSNGVNNIAMSNVTINLEGGKVLAEGLSGNASPSMPRSAP